MTSKSTATGVSIAFSLLLGAGITLADDVASEGSGDGPGVIIMDPAFEGDIDDALESEFYHRTLVRMGGHSRDGFDDVVVPTPADLPYTEIVNPERYVPGSVSVGHTSTGHLTGAARLPVDGEYHYVLPEHRERDTHYGTDELIAILLDAAERTVTEYPGSRMAVGNMSLENGGDIQWSRSHNTGRDADIAFFFVDEDGVPVEPDTLIYARRSLTDRHDLGWTFDVERNWALVEALLTSDEAQVQWLFIYSPLRRALLDYAVEIDADPELIAMASEVMHQPGDSARHDDHFHLRVYCSRDDRLEGCINWGPRRTYVDYFEEDMERRVLEVLRGLMDPDPETAQACVDFLDRLQPREQAFTIASAIPHQVSDVQIALMDLLGELDQPGVTGPIVPLAESASRDEVRRQALWLLGHLADIESAPAVAGIMVRDGRALDDGTSMREAAADALRNITNEDILPQLLEAIADPRPRVRERVAHVLHRTTGQLSPVRPGADLDEEEFVELLSFWETWYAETSNTSRDAWISTMFSDAGYDVGDLAGETVRLSELVRALEDGDDHIAFNADRYLMRLTGRWTPSEGWSVQRRVSYWQNYVTLD